MSVDNIFHRVSLGLRVIIDGDSVAGVELGDGNSLCVKNPRCYVY